jgi:hypothetical protein
MEQNDNSEVEKLIAEFCEAVSALSKANRLTGLWDHVRFEECKKPFESVDAHVIYTSEKNSRKNVEERARQRIILDSTIMKLININEKK